MSLRDIITTVVTQETEESYQFECPRCGAEWTTEYTVRRAMTRDGDGEAVYLRGGVPVLSPRAGVSCRRCGGLRVHATLSHVTFGVSPRAIE
jgi:transcription elongation factor Elf1